MSENILILKKLFTQVPLKVLGVIISSSVLFSFNSKAVGNPGWKALIDGSRWFLENGGNYVDLFVKDWVEARRFERVANVAESTFERDIRRYCYVLNRNAGIAEISLKVGADARGEYQRVIEQVYEINRADHCRDNYRRFDHEMPSPPPRRE
jgi:hypothetical protein